jgi:2-deoxy-D-gluconate 3-dehydrogenase
MGRKGLAQSVDIRQIGQLKDLAEKVKTEFGRFDILVNNAGYSGMVVKAFDIDEAEWDRTMDLNLKGMFFLSKAAASIMKEQGGGKILNISSVAGIKREDWTPGPYAISKAGVEMLTKALAQEWARYNIRINCIAPGLVHSELGDRTYDKPSNKTLVDQLVKGLAIRRIAQPEEIAGAALYLVSNASSYVTGVTIPVDGGSLVM